MICCFVTLCGLSLRLHFPRSEVDRLDRTLRHLRATLEVWLDVQRAWMALEPVFAAPDIQRQLPAEARAFVQVGWPAGQIKRVLCSQQLNACLPAQPTGRAGSRHARQQFTRINWRAAHTANIPPCPQGGQGLQGHHAPHPRPPRGIGCRRPARWGLWILVFVAHRWLLAIPQLGPGLTGPSHLVPPCTGWLDALNKCRATLEEVGKALEDYLETKRVAFPRCGAPTTRGYCVFQAGHLLAGCRRGVKCSPRDAKNAVTDRCAPVNSCPGFTSFQTRSCSTSWPKPKTQPRCSPTSTSALRACVPWNSPATWPRLLPVPLLRKGTVRVQRWCLRRRRYGRHRRLWRC